MSEKAKHLLGYELSSFTMTGNHGHSIGLRILFAKPLHYGSGLTEAAEQSNA